MKTEHPTYSDSIAHFTEQFINQTNQSVFLTGKAGTGKTTLLKKIVANTHKNTIIVAPTGIAALNAGGVTIHSFFGLPFSGFIPDNATHAIISGNTKIETKNSIKQHFHHNKHKRKIFNRLELLIVDEVSMLRADLLDAMDWTLRTTRKNHLPFGGVQVLFIGDLMQLPPVVKPDEWKLLQKHYAGIHFFNAHVMKEIPPVYIELKTIYRQDDLDFIQLLENLRNNRLTSSDKSLLDHYVKANVNSENYPGYITLTTHNQLADSMNQQALSKIKEKPFTYQAEIKGDFPQHIYPVYDNIQLKVGAQVMFIKNDLSADKLYYNGKMGVIASLSEDSVEVQFNEDNTRIMVDKYEWENIQYSVDKESNAIQEKIIGTFVQYPLRLAWAITVHKSQGLTFDKAILDVSRVFAPGQAYVALSRLRSLSGLILTQAMSINGLENDAQVVAYSQQAASKEQLEQCLVEGKLAFIQQAVMQAFDWKDMLDNWDQYAYSCRTAVSKTEKHNDIDWANEQLQTLQQLEEVANKFQKQLLGIFANLPTNWTFLAQRIEASYAYFFEPIDKIIDALIIRKIDLSLKKKTKQYIDLISELEEEATEKALRLMKIKHLLSLVVDGRELTKETMRSAEITTYKTAKIDRLIQQDLIEKQHKNVLFSDDESTVDIIKLITQKKKKKEPKKDTYAQTLELLEAGKTIEEVATIRVLNRSTIESHIARLIKNEKIELDSLMSIERINEVKAILQKHEGKNMGAIKEAEGDLVNYFELHWVQASMLM